MIRAVRRALDARAAARDAGATMVMVLGIMMVGAVITTTLATVTMFNVKQTVESRADMHALASADAGMDLMLSLFEGKNYNQLNTVCSRTFVIDSDTVNVTTSYTVTRAGATTTVPCPLATDITQSITVTSTATSDPGPVGGETSVRTVAALFTATVPTMTLDKAVFSENAVTLTNNLNLAASGAVDSNGVPIYDAHVYSNSTVTCKTYVNTGGNIYAAQGDIILENGCKIGNTVWAQGKVNISSQAMVSGNVYSQSSDAAAVTLQQNTSLVLGSVLTNGGVSMNGGDVKAANLTDRGGVAGSIYARTGPLLMTNGGSVGGSAYIAGIITFNGSKIYNDAVTGTSFTVNNNGNTVLGKATTKSSSIPSNLTAGTKITSKTFAVPTDPNPTSPYKIHPAVGWGGTITAPPREQMPKLTMSAADIAKWGWSTLTVSNKCTGSDPTTVLNGVPAGPPTIVVFTGCSSPVNFDNATITLKTDIAIVTTTGISGSNVVTFKSDGATQRNLYMIVPSDAPGVSWNAVGTTGQTTPVCSTARDIRFSRMMITKVNMFIYTPCTFNFQNPKETGSDPLVGQIYAGTASWGGDGAQIKMKTMPVPSLATTAPVVTQPADLRMSSRYDVRGS